MSDIITPNVSASYKITIGASKNHKSWRDVRLVTWLDLCKQLTCHEVGTKDGYCFTPAIFEGIRRTKKEAREIGLLVLDCDTGEPLEQIRDALQKACWKAIIYSTHSHLTAETEISATAYKKSGYSSPELYLIHEKGMQGSVASEASFVVGNNKIDTDTLTIKHNPCPKFRVVMPLSVPWKAADFLSQEQANAVWSDFVINVAKTLGLQHDQSCTDSARLYYFPRHPAGAPHVTEVLDGVAIDPGIIISSISECKDKPTEYKETAALESFVYTNSETGAQLDLIKWSAQHAKDFDIVSVLKAQKPDVFNGHVADGCKHHILCVNSKMHTKQEPDNATFIVSPDQSPTGSFVFHCMHAHCVNEDRLFFILKMLENGWLRIEDLSPAGLNTPLTFIEIKKMAELLTPDDQPSTIQAVIKEINRSNLDPISRENIFAMIKSKTGVALKALRQSSVLAAEGSSIDTAYYISQKTLDKFFAGGAHLIRAADRCFWRYNGKYWERMGNEQVEHYVLELVKECASPRDGEEYRKMLKNSLDLIISRQALDINFFQRLGEMPSVINCQNGELWLQDDGTQLLKPHSPDSYLQYVLSFSYDPNATCEKFDAALLSTFSESENPAEMARHFLEMMGYIIQPARFLTCWFMLTGNGDNGKTTLFETLVQLMSKNAIFSGRINEIEQNRFMIGSLLGKLLLVDDDVDKGTKLPDGMMKKLSEKKLLTGEKKFKDSFEFQSSVAVLLLANNYPQCDDLSHGMRRRAKIVPFNRNFSKGGKDPALFPYIWKNEMSGVLNRLIQGLQRVRQRGDFDEPADCISARETWLTNANPLMAFLKECCEPAEEDCYVSLNHVYQTFTNWKNKNGFSKKTTSQELHSDLKSSGYTSRKINGCQRIYGIRIVLGVS